MRSKLELLVLGNSLKGNESLCAQILFFHVFTSGLVC